MKDSRKFPLVGQALIEYALIIPVFMLIVMVIFDLGRAVYYYSAIHNAAREGARFAVIEPGNTTGIETAARRLTAGLDQGNLTITIGSVTFPEGEPGIEVQISYIFTPATPVLGKLFGSGVNQITLDSQASMQIEVANTGS